MGGARPLPFAARELLVACAVVAALVVGMYLLGTERVGLAKDDAGQYARMAEDPTYLARLPYTFRVLTPRLAGLWPGDHVAGFTAVTLLGLIVAGTCLYAYCRAVGLGIPAALAASALFAISGGVVRLLTTPVYVDGLTYALTVAAFLFLALDRFWPFLAVVCLGVLNRETALLLVPLYLLVAWPVRVGWRAALVVLLPSGLALAVVLGQLWGGGAFVNTTSLAALRPAPSAMRQLLPSLTDLFDLFSTFGVLWLLAARNLPGPTPFLRRASAFGLLVVGQLVVARGDEGRVLSHLFPVVLPLAMLDVQRAANLGGRPGTTWGGILVMAAAASMVNARWVFVEPTELRYALVAAGTAAALVAVWRLRALSADADTATTTSLSRPGRLEAT